MADRIEIKGIPIREGTCPYCGSSDITYFDYAHDDFGLHYNAQCCECGEDFQECYDLEFSGMYKPDNAIVCPPTDCKYVNELPLYDRADGTLYGHFHFNISCDDFEEAYNQALDDVQDLIENYGDDVYQVVTRLKEMNVDFSYEDFDSTAYGLEI